MYNVLLVAAGGAAGAAARYIVSSLALRRAGDSWPWGTFAINVAGSLLLGLLIGALAGRADQGASHLRLVLGTGVLGGFTTFSAYSLETVRLIEDGRHVSAAGYALGSVCLGVAAAAAGVWMARRFFS